MWEGRVTKPVGVNLTKTDQDPKGENKQYFSIGTKNEDLNIWMVKVMVRKVLCYKAIISPPE